MFSPSICWRFESSQRTHTYSLVYIEPVICIISRSPVLPHANENIVNGCTYWGPYRQVFGKTACQYFVTAISCLISRDICQVVISNSGREGTNRFNVIVRKRFCGFSVIVTKLQEYFIDISRIHVKWSLQFGPGDITAPFWLW